MHRHHHKRILFVLKHREAGSPGCWNYSDNGGHLSSGLYNSVRFIVDMLNDEGVEAKLVHVIDNNHIDREVTKFKPTHVIVEAYWVVPEKFDVLMRLHPRVQWMVRNHSKTEFLAQEGIGFGWTIEYLRKGISVACNALDTYKDFVNLAKVIDVDPSLVSYLPNYYPIDKDGEIFDWRRDIINRFRSYKTMDIGCFGAIRPLKNHVNQALAALDFAKDVGAKLRFHINSTRVEGNASPILNNLRGIFLRLDKHQLVEHEWMEHHDFLKALPKMEIVTQVTFSETFNIVAADAVSQGVAVAGSSEIPWLPMESVANPNSVESISRLYRKIWKDLNSGVHNANARKSLCEYSEQSKYVWVNKFRC